VGEVNRILEFIRKYFLLEENTEITLEANPDDINPGLLHDYLDIGINRLSIGVQSFFDDDLQYLNRIHSGLKAEESVLQAKNAGFTNISIDLIYAIPTLTQEKWKQNLEKAFLLDIPHISAYSLTVEPKTALDLLIRKKKLPCPEEEDFLDHFRILIKMMKEHGFEHYEISNFCRAGMNSRHNLRYWQRRPYLGLGLDASSMLIAGEDHRVLRSTTTDDLNAYLEGSMPVETTWLTRAQQHEEAWFLGLRLNAGVDVAAVQREFGEAMVAPALQAVARLAENGLLSSDGKTVRLTAQGRLLSNNVFQEFLGLDDGLRSGAASAGRQAVNRSQA